MKVVIQFQYSHFYHSGIQERSVTMHQVTHTTLSTYMSAPTLKTEWQMLDIGEDQDNVEIACRGCDMKLDFPVRTLRNVAGRTECVLISFTCLFRDLITPLQHEVTLMGPMDPPSWGSGNENKK